MQPICDSPSATIEAGSAFLAGHPAKVGGEGAAMRGAATKAVRVLVVEDDAMIGILLTEMLTDMGYICSYESTEAGAIAAAGQSRPQLMIVDVGLGGGSGISAVDEITRGGVVPHVFISGDIARVRALRPDAVTMQKPFRETDLVRAIDRAMGGPTLQ